MVKNQMFSKNLQMQAVKALLYFNLLISNAFFVNLQGKFVILKPEECIPGFFYCCDVLRKFEALAFSYNKKFFILRHSDL